MRPSQTREEKPNTASRGRNALNVLRIPQEEKGGVLLTVGEIKEKKEKGKEGEGEKRESVEEMALI